MHERSSSRGRRMSAGAGKIALSLGLCLCAGQLVSTPAAHAATPAPVVAQVATAKAAAKVKPTVRTSVSTRTLAWGAKVKVTARYLNPTNGKAVTSGYVRLQALRNGKWQNWASGKVNKNGAVALYGQPKVSGSLRMVYLGTSTFAPQVGGRLSVKVVASGAKVLAEAQKHTGALYLFGASGPSRFDCSGFTKYVYKKAAGKNLAHKANSQQSVGRSVSKGAKKAGDLIIFRNGSYGYHAAIYAGNGYMYDSPHTGARVSKRKMISTNYVVRRLV
ncbi:C40 family peptidase [Paractinoplanes atraurantiacus]|nr:NlpC/P60 family protein [Actinoplanes atraurantiacus]